MDHNQQSHTHEHPVAPTSPTPPVSPSHSRPTAPMVSIFDNPVSMSVILGAFIVAISIIVGAAMIKGSSMGSTKDADKGSTVLKVAERKDAPFIGNPKAKLTVVEFGDFQCAFCQRFYSETYTALKTKYIDTGKVKFVFRHYPLNQIHVNAQISSEASECANRQGRFEDYYNVLYTKGQPDGTGLDSASLKGYASQLGLDMTNFNKCLDGHEAADVVSKDLAAGNSIGVQGTPSFLVNGELIVGAQPIAAFEQAFDKALAK